MRALLVLLAAGCASVPHPWTATTLPPGGDELVPAGGLAPLRSIDGLGPQVSAAWRHGFDRFEVAGSAAWEGVPSGVVSVAAEGRTSLRGGGLPVAVSAGLAATFGARTSLSPGAAINAGIASPREAGPAFPSSSSPGSTPR